MESLLGYANRHSNLGKVFKTWRSRICEEAVSGDVRCVCTLHTYNLYGVVFRL